MDGIGSLLQIGINGVHSGIKNAQKAAENIVKSSVGLGEQGVAESTDVDEFTDNGIDLTTAIVELKASELQVKASAKVVQVADEIIGTLIDTKI
jgi:hypothetical protein